MTDIEDVFHLLLENLMTTSGGELALVSARELVETEARSLLSGSSNVLEEVIAKSSLEIAEYFRQAFRTRESLSVLNPALLCASKNGFNLNFVILPPGQKAHNMRISSSAFMVLATDSNIGKPTQNFCPKVRPKWFKMDKVRFFPCFNPRIPSIPGAFQSQDSYKQAKQNPPKRTIGNSPARPLRRT